MKENANETEWPAETEEAPQVYAVQKGLTGWRFNRRDFLTATSVITAAVVTGAAAGCGFSASPEEKACKKVKAHGGEVRDLVVSPDGTLLISASADNTIKAWSLPEAGLVKTLTGHSGDVNAVAMSPDGAILASASDDQTVKLWSLPEGELLKTLEGHSDEALSLAMGSTGTCMTSGDGEGIIKLWSLPGGELTSGIRIDPQLASAIGVRKISFCLWTVGRWGR